MVFCLIYVINSIIINTFCLDKLKIPRYNEKYKMEKINMKLDLSIFGSAIACCIVFLILGYALIDMHMFSLVAGWAIFAMGLGFGLAIALAMVYFEIITRSFK